MKNRIAKLELLCVLNAFTFIINACKKNNDEDEKINFGLLKVEEAPPNGFH